MGYEKITLLARFWVIELLTRSVLDESILCNNDSIFSLDTERPITKKPLHTDMRK
jgi:hypothetical protein